MPYSNIVIYHNPRCSKSRAAYNYLQERDIKFDTIEYQTNIPSESDIKHILQLLDLPLAKVIRTNDAAFKKLNIDLSQLDYNQVVKLISCNIKILQRPIVILDDTAIIARPIDNLTNLLKK